MTGNAWKVIDGGYVARADSDGWGGVICDYWMTRRLDPDLRKAIDANGRLIAAAPELLEALECALPYVCDVLDNPAALACFKRGVVQGHYKAICGAIAKATQG